MSNLSQKTCQPCKGGTPSLTPRQVEPLISELDQGWTVIEHHHLEKQFKLSDFKAALEFTSKIGNLAEEQGHHPDIYLAWGKVKVQIWTHKIDGLTESDFILAAKIDEIL